MMSDRFRQLKHSIVLHFKRFWRWLGVTLWFYIAFPKKSRHFLNPLSVGTCWDFEEKMGGELFFSKKLNIWYTATVWQQSDYVSRLKNWFPKMKTIWSSDLEGSLQNNWATFSKMELFSKACKILLRPPITFIFFLTNRLDLKDAVFFFRNSGVA